MEIWKHVYFHIYDNAHYMHINFSCQVGRYLELLFMVKMHFTKYDKFLWHLMWLQYKVTWQIALEHSLNVNLNDLLSWNKKYWYIILDVYVCRYLIKKVDSRCRNSVTENSYKQRKKMITYPSTNCKNKVQESKSGCQNPYIKNGYQWEHKSPNKGCRYGKYCCKNSVQPQFGLSK